MFSRPLSSLSRVLFVTSLIGLGSSSLIGQDSSSSPAPSPAPASKPAAPKEPAVSRWDIFTGYSYLSPHGTVKVPYGGTTFDVKPSSVDVGAIGSLTYYFNRYVGGQLEYGAHPDGKNDGFYTAQAGVVFRYPMADVTPFVHGLVGAVKGGGPYHQPYTWGPALTVGGGMDYKLWGDHVALRLFQADYEYMHINFGPQSPPGVPWGGRANYNVARLSTGLVWKFGNIVPPPPVTYACAATPDTVFPGDPITITGTPTNLNPKKTATYSWSGQGVSGDQSTVTVKTDGLSAGSYTATGHVSEGPKAGQSADCTANYTVKAYEPPTVSCSADPSTIKPGESSNVTAQGVSPQNRPLTYTYAATSGSISGSGNTATLSSAGAPAGSITVTCTVQDDKGQTASSTTTVSVEAPPPPAPKTQTLCSIGFDRDKRRPARVDNEAKACLDEVALNLQRQSDASAVLVGEAAAPAKKTKKFDPAKLASQRAVNTKDYLVKEKGIDASRISVRTGASGENKVENYLVPSGATFDNDVQGTTTLDESSVKVQPRTAPHHSKKKKK